MMPFWCTFLLIFGVASAADLARFENARNVSLEFGGDIPEYFARYRRKLAVRDDIRKNSGLSTADRARITKQ